MSLFGPLEEAALRQQFRAMYRDIGMLESIIVLNEILTTAKILNEVLQDEMNESEKDEGMGTP